MRQQSDEISVVRVGNLSVPFAVGMLIAGAGLTIMAEWAFNFKLIALLSPTDSSMKFNSSFVFFLFGLSLALKSLPDRRAWLAGRILAAFGMLIAFLTFTQYLTGHALGIDELIMYDHPQADITSSPGRMSPLVAVNFLLFGVSLFTWRQPGRPGKRPSEAFALAALLMPTMVALGYTFRADSLYSFTTVTGVAFITACLFLIFGVGVLAVESPGGIATIFLSRTRGGFVLRFLLPTSLFAILAIDWLTVYLSRRGLLAENMVVPLGTLVSGGLITILIWRSAKLLFDADLKERETVAELERAYRTAEEANRAKDEFISVVSHELRTPLNSILGWLQILRLDRSEKNVRRAVEVIGRQSENQLQLVEDLLDTSRIVAGKMRLDIRDVCLASVIDEAVETVRPAAAAKRIELDWNRTSAEITVAADADRLQQVFWNLLSNAIKFTPPDGRVGIELDLAGDSAKCCVKDNGEGVAREFLPFIFDRFRQADESPGRRTGGLGLGLSLVRSIVELHGGKVSAASDGIGKGTCFTVSLPVKKQERLST